MILAAWTSRSADGGALTARVTEHGRWTGAEVEISTGALPGAGFLTVARLRAAADSCPAPALPLTPREVCSRWASTSVLSAGAGDEVSVDVSLTSPEQIAYRVVDGDLVLTNDLRLLAREPDAALDLRGAYALLQYSAIPSPLTLVEGTSRVPPGHRLTFCLRSRRVSLRRATAVPRQEHVDAPGQVAATAIRSVLRDVAGPAALLFSGGVDSSLLAAYLKESGRADVPLVNYSFGADDVEARQAADVAGRLGMPLLRIDHRDADVAQVLARLGREHTFPFGDRSVLPTNLLVHGALRELGCQITVLDGTGADGAFGAWAARSRLAGVPVLARRALGAAHSARGVWMRRGPLEERLRRARQSKTMSVEHAVVVGEASLEGLAYHLPAGLSDELEQLLTDHIDELAGHLDPEGRLSLLDLVHVCAGRFAAKTFDPLRLAGARPSYPFLSPDVVDVALALPYEQKCPGGTSKSLLKAELERFLPWESVHRPKSGFTPPFARLMRDPSVQSFVRDVVLHPDNELLSLCDQPMTRRIFSAVSRGEGGNAGVHGFTWNLMFLSAWWLQVRDARTRAHA